MKYLMKVLMRKISVSKTIAALDTLSDHQLRDIGLYRGDIIPYVNSLYPKIKKEDKVSSFGYRNFLEVEYHLNRSFLNQVPDDKLFGLTK